MVFSSRLFTQYVEQAGLYNSLEWDRFGGFLVTQPVGDKDSEHHQGHCPEATVHLNVLNGCSL